MTNRKISKLLANEFEQLDIGNVYSTDCGVLLFIKGDDDSIHSFTINDSIITLHIFDSRYGKIKHSKTFKTVREAVDYIILGQ